MKSSDLPDTFSQTWWPPSIELDPTLIDDPSFDFNTASPWRVTVWWVQIGEKMEPVAIRFLTVRPDLTGPVTPGLLREIPVGRVLAKARHDFLTRAEEVGWMDPDHWQGKNPRKGSEHYEKVAAIYRDAYGRGLPPTKAVKQHFDVSQSTAAKYVARARNEYGLLPPTKQGQKGIG